MLNTASSIRGMVTAPHNLAAESGAAVLRDGGNALEAMVAAAATIAVVYPHMNALGGDGFWLIHRPGRPPVAIDACGGAGAKVTPALYAGRGLEAVPPRGPLAANTVAGTVAGWRAALELAAEAGGRLSLARLLDDAIHYAEAGMPVTVGQALLTAEKQNELHAVPGFSDTFLDGAAPPAAGARFRQPRLAATLKALAEAGLEDFYRGGLARRIAADLAAAGSPITAADLAAYKARVVEPLALPLSHSTAYNLPPPTQGLVSLMILGLFDGLDVAEAESFEHVHGLVEASKQAFLVRDAVLTDPARMEADPREFLTEAALAELRARIDMGRALSWPQPGPPGDTVWLGAADAEGRVVSFIQSLYWEFGSGVVLADTGILWQNRGASFQLAETALNRLRPGRKPFHTLNPALAVLADGRVMAYGAMGGEGQPQTQAAVFTRYVQFGQGLQRAVTAPRWLLGRRWGEEGVTLKLEQRFDPALVAGLMAAGHDVEVVEPFSQLVGHAGAVVRHADGTLEGAADPRSDGQAVGF